MVKIPKSSSYKEIKQFFSKKIADAKAASEEKIKDANEYLSQKAKQGAKKAANWADEKINDPKIKEKAQKAADWTSEKLDDAKDTYEKLKQKYAELTMAPPKLQVLGEKVTELQKQFLFKSAILGELKRRAPEQTMMIYKREKELMQLEQKTKKAIDEYNKFAAQQAAAQEAFNRLNGFNK